MNLVFNGLGSLSIIFYLDLSNVIKVKRCIMENDCLIIISSINDLCMININGSLSIYQ